MLGVLALALFMVLIFLNVPISISMGLASAISLMIMGVPGEVVPQKIVSGIQSWVLLAAPFFILAAQIMNRGGVTERLFHFANELVGWLRGGLAHANILASMIFAGISGAAAADASGLGLIEIKAMSDAGYEKKFAIGVTAASCMLGPIIPPSIMLILYGHLAELSIAALWFAGIIPGILTGILLMAYVYYAVSTGKTKAPFSNPFSFARLWLSFKNNIFMLFLPVLLLGAIVSGLATPTETGIIACIYAFVLSMAYNGSRFMRQIPQILIDATKASAIILFIIGTATPFVWIITREETALVIGQALFSISDNKYVILIIVNVFLLIVGALIEQIPAMLVIVPLLHPLALELGINPVHFGLMVVFNLMIGMITPPMGLALYIMGAITDVPMKDIIRSSMSFFLVLVLALMLITYIPFLSTFIPELLGMSMS